VVSELRVSAKPRNKVAYTISKIMEVMESLDRDTMVKAFKRFRSGTEAVVAANFLKIFVKFRIYRCHPVIISYV
jgi:hypothetical protein